MPTLFESQHLYSTHHNIRGAFWGAQTFTPLKAHRITQLVLRVFRIASPGTVTVSIRATTGGAPSGADLASATFNGNAVTTDSDGENVTLYLSEVVSLTQGTTYAIVVRAPAAPPPDGDNEILPKMQQVSAYPRGSVFWSEDSGGTWAEDGSGGPGVGDPFDYVFEEWGLADSLLHVAIGGKVAAGVVAARNS